MDITVETKIRNDLQNLVIVCLSCAKNKEHDCGTCSAMANTYAGMKELMKDFVKENAFIDRDIFRTVVSEFPPSICEDSGQPDWCQGELDKCLDALMAERPIKIR